MGSSVSTGMLQAKRLDMSKKSINYEELLVQLQLQGNENLSRVLPPLPQYLFVCRGVACREGWDGKLTLGCTDKGVGSVGQQALRAAS
mmetsp:Transcript_40694/g.99018  ORF Transcript_40694/g.99018 Transcript_40694/m.99018 type:complete len:88 (-) Transcript_40694:1130-1393(-)